MTLRSRAAALMAILSLSAGLAPAAAQEETRLLRFPDIHGDRVVFTYAGDLWLAPAGGGTATRLTTHPGLELFAKFSPDGESIAFTGQYAGDEQVYVIPTRGGEPAQLTFYPARGPLPDRWGYDNQVYGWTPDGSSVLFRSLRDAASLTDTRLYTVPVSGGLPTALAMPVSGAGDLSPDGNRAVYSPKVRDFRTWKRYEGGWAQDLYIFDLANTTATQITDHPRTDRDPMWIGDAIWFASDRDDTLNLYRYDPASGATTQATEYTDWDVRWPSSDGVGRIVYELNGGLRVHDTASGDDRAIAIFVPDDGRSRRAERVKADGNIQGWGLSPGGERALFVARGDVFTAPIEKGLVRNLTASATAHDREASWSPDGRQIAFISDRTGEEELWLVNQDLSGEAAQVTEGSRTRYYQPTWSGDGKHIAYTDKDGRLLVVTLRNKRVTEVADESFGRLTQFAWSPNGGHLAYRLSEPSGMGSIHIWSVGDGRSRQVTSEMFNDSRPAWSPDGQYLYFVSDRQFQPQIGSFEWNYLVDRESGIYALALRKDVPALFPPENDEVDGDDGKENGDNGNDKKDEKKKPIRIDFDGLADRLMRVPMEADNINGLAVTKTHIVYQRTGPFYYGRQPDVTPTLMAYSLEDREAKQIADKLAGWAISADGKHVLVAQNGAYKLYPTKGGKSEPKTVATDGLETMRVPAEEWATIFDEAWRRFRDHFYVDNMHGYDWEALRDQYRPQLEHVGHRSDLNYVIGEMIAELAVSHAYIAGGDTRLPTRPNVSLPGARFELDEDAGRYRIARILAGENAEPNYRSPLTEVGVGVGEGDYVLAVNGRPLTAEQNPYELLQLPPGRPVELTVSDRASGGDTRTAVFEPIPSETSLIYLAMVRENHRRVTEATDGRVGYLHIPDMGSNGIREFIKWYYPQIRKDGLVVDVRGNGGGNVSQMLIERLRRELLGLTYVRTAERANTYPNRVFTGPMVALMNETSASDGDIFSAMFQEAELGPVIGQRSWGGIIGITNRGPLLDGGTVFVPEFGTASKDGRWVIEGIGVEPDIEVENDPVSIIEGRDPQLERALAELERAMAEQPAALPARPAPPDKSPAAR